MRTSSSPRRRVIPLDYLVGEEVHALEVAAATEGREVRKELEQRAAGPLGHAVLGHGFVGPSGDEGEKAERGRPTARELLDHPGEAEFFVGGEERRRGPEGIGEELDPFGEGVRVRQALDEFFLGSEVHLGEIDDPPVTTGLLDEIDVGVGSSPTEAELHAWSNTPNIMNMSLESPIHQCADLQFM